MSQRTIEPGLAFSGACDVRVALMPVGPVPKEVLDGYARALHRRRHVPLASVRPHYRDAQKSPFPNMPWSASGGALRLRLLAGGGDGARRRSRLADLHAGRRVVAVLGIAHGPSSPDKEALRAEFQAACRAFPEALVSRCFVVDCEDAATTVAAADNTNTNNDDGALVLVPPPPAPHLAAADDDDNPHLDAAIASFAAAVLQGLESAVLGSGPSSVRLPSPYADGPEFGNNSSLGSSGMAPQGPLASLAAALGAAATGGAGAAANAAGAGLSSGVAAAIGGGDGAAAASTAAPTTTTTPPPPPGPLEEALRARLAHGGGAAGGGSLGSVSSNNNSIGSASAAAAAAAAAIDEEQQLREKRRWGRLQKSKGDLALMAGSPLDAREHYRSGADLSRAAGDAVWAAAGLEGLAAARLAEAVLWVAQKDAGAGKAERERRRDGGMAEEQQRGEERQHQGGDDAAAAPAPAAASPNNTNNHNPLLPRLRRAFTPSLERDVRALCAEAARQYGRRSGPGPAALQAELALRLARLLAALRGPRARRDVLALTGAALDALPLLPSADDRVVALAEAAHCLGLAGCARKRALLLWQAGDQCRLLPDPQAGRVALRTLALALGQGGGDRVEEVGEDDDDDDEALSSPAPGLDEGDVGCGSGGGGGGNLPAPSAAASSQHHQQRARRRNNQHQQQHWSLVLRDAGLRAQRQQVSAAPDERPLAAEAAPAVGPPSSLSSPWLPGTSYSGAPLPNFPPSSTRRQQQHAAAAPLCVLEALLSAARRAGAAEEAWEAAAALLRLHGWSPALPGAQQAALADVLAQAAASFSPAARVRLSEGPGPLAALVRVAPAAPALRAFLLPPEDSDEERQRGVGGAAAAAAASSTADANGPFIFDAMAARRKQETGGKRAGGANNAAASSSPSPLLPGEPAGPPAEWVCGDEGAVEIDLCNPTAVPLRLDDLRLDLEWGDEEQARGQEGEERANGGGAPNGAAAVSSGGGAPVSARFVATPPLSLTLPVGRAPVRVALAATPQRPGALRVRGLLASCWGVTWRVPLLPTEAAAAAGGDNNGDDNENNDNNGVSAKIRVLPRLPLLRAVLQGPDGLHAVRPAEGELSPTPLLPLTSVASAATAAASSAGGPAARTSDGGGGGPPTPPPPASASAAAVAAAGRAAPPVLVGAVLEGQRLRWSLALTNASRSAARRVRVGVAPAAAGSTGLSPSPPQQAPLTSLSGGAPVLPDGFVGAHVLVGAAESEGGGGGDDSPMAADAAAAAAAEGGSASSSFSLPPGRSATVPLTVLVGRAPSPGDSLDNTTLCVHVTYCGGGGGGEAEEGDDDDDDDGGGTGGPDDEGELLPAGRSASTAPRPRYGRRLTVVLRFAVQPSLTITRARFAAAPVPLVGGAHAATTTNATTTTTMAPPSSSPPTPAWALAPAINVRSSAAFEAGQPSSPGPAAGGPSPSPSSPLRRTAVAAAQQQPQPPPRSWPAAALGAGGPALGVGCDAVLELGLSNRSDRYYRAWVAPLVAASAAGGTEGGGGGGASGGLPSSPGAAGSPSRLDLGGGGGNGGADAAESAVAVLEPGDEACLLAALARHGATAVAAAMGGGASAAALPSHNDLRSSAAGLAASGSGGGGGVDGASALRLAATEAAIVGAAPLVPPRVADADVEWRRLVAAAAARVSSRLALCWEAITGDRAAERARRGVLRLPAGLLVRALLSAAGAQQPPPTPPLATGALAVLVPPALRLAVEVVGASSTGALPVALADVTDDLRRLGVVAASSSASAAAAAAGQQQQQQQQHAALSRARAYGVRASPGDVLELRVAVAMLGQAEEEEEVRLTVACRRLGGGGGDDGGGVLLSGALQGTRVRLSSGRAAFHPFGAVCLAPGAYELAVRDVGVDRAAAGPAVRPPGVLGGAGDASAARLASAMAPPPPARAAATPPGQPAPSGVYAGVRPLLLVVV